jgi:hypothetical protein
LRISMQKRWQIIHYSVINYNMYHGPSLQIRTTHDLPNFPRQKSFMAVAFFAMLQFQHYFAPKTSALSFAEHSGAGGDCSVIGTDRMDPFSPAPNTVVPSGTVWDPLISMSLSQKRTTARNSLHGE